MRKWLSLFLVVLMFVPMLASAEAEIPAGEGEVVTIWECNWGGDPYEAALIKLAEQATAANIDGKGYKVEVSMIAWDNFYETFLTAVMAGTAPDIACEASTGPLMYAEMGQALDLTPVYDAWVAEGNPIATEISQVAWDFWKYQDQLIAIPFAVQHSGIAYRKDLFEKAGIAQLPTTWEELEAACVALKAIDVMPMVFPADSYSSLGNFCMLMQLSNNAFSVGLGETAVLNSKENMEVYEYVDKMYKNGYIPEGILGYTNSDAQRMFLNGEAAIYLVGAPTWVPEDMLDVVGAMTAFHGPSSDTPRPPTSFQAYHAFDQNGHPEATLAVLKWWLENNDILWTEGNNVTVSCRPDQAARTLRNELMVDWANQWNLNPNAVSGTYPYATFQSYSSAKDAEGVDAWVFEAIFSGDDYKEAVAGYNEQLEELLADYK